MLTAHPWQTDTCMIPAHVQKALLALAHIVYASAYRKGEVLRNTASAQELWQIRFNGN